MVRLPQLVPLSLVVTTIGAPDPMPEAVQLIVVVVPVQLALLNDPVPGSAGENVVTAFQVVPPFVLCARIGAEPSSPAAIHMALVVVPVQLAPLNAPLDAMPVTGVTVKELPPFVLTASSGLEVRLSTPAATQMAVEPLPVQLTAFHIPEAACPLTV